MTRRQRALLTAAALAHGGCLWESRVGEVDARDAGQGSRERFEAFAARLVGTYTGTASSASVTITQTFNADGSFEGTCKSSDNLLAGLCQGIEGSGSYVLNRFDASGDVSGVLTDSNGRMSQLEAMRFDEDGQLTYLLIASFDPAVVDRLRDAGLSFFSSNAWRSYVVLQKR